MGRAVGLREDFETAELRRLATRVTDAAQARRLLALAAVRDGMNRTEAARIGGIDRQTLRDWVHRFNEGWYKAQRILVTHVDDSVLHPCAAVIEWIEMRAARDVEVERREPYADFYFGKARILLCRESLTGISRECPVSANQSAISISSRSG